MKKVEEISGSLGGDGLRFALVVARFNDLITERLLDGAVDALIRHGVEASDLQVIRVPGAWELPGAAAQVLARGGVDGVVALGCVIRGDTPHFEYVAGEAARRPRCPCPDLPCSRDLRGPHHRHPGPGAGTGRLQGREQGVGGGHVGAGDGEPLPGTPVTADPTVG
jgi:hypothetical protein